jgi:hypothetical protein
MGCNFTKNETITFSDIHQSIDAVFRSPIQLQCFVYQCVLPSNAGLPKPLNLDLSSQPLFSQWPMALKKFMAALSRSMKITQTKNCQKSKRLNLESLFLVKEATRVFMLTKGM